MAIDFISMGTKKIIIDPELVKIVQNIIHQSESVCEKVIQSAIDGGELELNNTDYWIEYLKNNTTFLTFEDYKQIHSDSIITLHNQVMMGRSKQNGLDDKISGYMGEFGFKKYSQEKHGKILKLAHQAGDVEQFKHKDIYGVKDHDLEDFRDPRVDIGIKSSNFGAVWHEFAKSELARYQVFCKSLSDKDHGFKYRESKEKELDDEIKRLRMELFKYEPNNESLLKYKSDIEKFSGWSEEQIDKHYKENKFEDIPILIVGYVDTKKDYKKLDHQGVFKKNTYHIFGYQGLWSKPLENELVENLEKSLSEDQRKGLINKETSKYELPKIKFSRIGELKNAKNKSVFLFNIGALEKNFDYLLGEL